MTLCTLHAATVLSRDCRADFGRPLAKKVMSHSRDGPGVTAPSRTNIVPLTAVWNPPPSYTLPPPPLKVPDLSRFCFALVLMGFRQETIATYRAVEPPEAVYDEAVESSCLGVDARFRVL